MSDSSNRYVSQVTLTAKAYELQVFQVHRDYGNVLIGKKSIPIRSTQRSTCRPRLCSARDLLIARHEVSEALTYSLNATPIKPA